MVGWPQLWFIGPNEKPPRWQRASKKIQSFDHRQVVDLDYLLWLRSFTYWGGLWSPTGATQLGRPLKMWLTSIEPRLSEPKWHTAWSFECLYICLIEKQHGRPRPMPYFCALVDPKKCNAASKITLQCHKNLSDWKHSPQRTKISKLLHFTMTEHIHISRRPCSIQIYTIALIN